MFKFPVLFFTLFLFNINFSQIINPEIAVQSTTVNFGQSADVSFRSNNGEFWNIWQFNGTITWDPSVCTFNGLTSSQLSQMSMNDFDTTLVSSGVLIWAWTHMISIGQSIPQGQEIFTLNFKAVGPAGSNTTIGFTNFPQALYWNNFAGWSGTIDTVPGIFSIAGCPPTTASFTSIHNGLDFDFINNSSSISPQTWYWDFGDGSSSTLMNPSHSYLYDSSYNVCLYVSDSCGSDTLCQMVNPCFLPLADFNINGNGLEWNFTNNSNSGSNSNWYWDFGNGDSSSLQNPNYTYVLDSTYVVCLTVTDDCGQNTFCDTIMAYDNTDVNTSNNEQISIFPNPSDGVFNIYSKNTLNKLIQIEIFNIAGKLISFEKSLINFSKSFDLRSVKNGIYLVKLTIDDKRYFQKVIKK